MRTFSLGCRLPVIVLTAMVMVAPPGVASVGAAPGGMSGSSAGSAPGGIPDSPPPAPADVSSPAGGVERDGSYRHRMVVDVPRFAGLEPVVGVEYSSTAGAGLAGWGWSVVGDSVIERTSRGVGVPALDASDVFVLDGIELIPCTQQKAVSPSCATGGTHSTELETFQRVGMEGSDWSVWARDGTRSVYRDASPAAAPGTVWRLSERVNTHGDRVRYQRWCDGPFECYLDQIELEDAALPADRTTVQLRYEPRPDPYSYGAGGAVVAVRQRLTAILVTTAGQNREALAVTYWPLTTGGSPVSQVHKLTRYGADVIVDPAGQVVAGTPFPAEVFPRVAGGMATGTPASGTAPLAAGFGAPWQDDGGTSYQEWSASTTLGFENVHPSTQQWLPADVDGDGHTDVVGSVREADAAGVEHVRLRVALNKDLGTGRWKHTSQLTPWLVGNVSSPRWRLLTADFNDDGRSDLANVSWDYKTNTLMFEVAISDGVGAFALQGPVSTGLTTWDERTRWLTGDVDGDRRPDLIGVHRLPADTAITYPHAELVVGFARADGTIGSFVSTTTTWPFRDEDSPHWFAGDHDGDGRTDLLRVVQLPPDTQRAYWHAGLATAVSNGDGTFALTETDTEEPFESPVFPARYANSPLGTDLAQAGDFDGNGKTDLMFTRFYAADPNFANYDHLGFTVALADDLGGFELVNSKSTLGATRQNAYLSANWGPNFPNRWFAGDVDGDGVTDLVVTSPTAFNGGSANQPPATLQVLTLISNRDGTFIDPSSPGTVTSFDFTCWVVGAGCEAGSMGEVLPGDVNGDGRLDVVYAAPNAAFNLMLGTVPAPNTGLDDWRWQTTDLTGDGRSDRVYVQYTNSGLLVRSAIADPAQPNGSRLVASTVAGVSAFDDADMRKWLTIDVGRPGGGQPDGRADLVQLHRYTAPLAADRTIATVLLSDGDGTFSATSSTVVNPDPRPDQRSWLPVDVNGDGRVDLVRTTPATPTTVHAETLLAVGDGTWQYRADQPSVLGGITGARHFLPADVNGDGLGDIVHVEAGATGATLTETVISLIGRGDGTWISHAEVRVVARREPVDGWHAAELNGDGRTDLVRVTRSPGTVNLERLVAAGRGTWEQSVSSATVARVGARWNVLDADGDGRSDLAMVASVINGATRAYWAINDGTNFAVVSAPISLPARSVSQWQAVDVNDDGTDDLVLPRRSAGDVELATVLSPWRRPLLTQTYNGFGLTTLVHYTTSAGSFSEMPVGVNLPLVAALARQAPQASTGNGFTTYTYSGARYHFGRQRFLGFGTIMTAQGPSITVTTQRQTLACGGRPERIERRDATGAVFNADNTTYADTSLTTSGPWPCLPTRQSREDCERTTTCRTVVTDHSYDLFGNTTATVESGEYADGNRDGVDDQPGDNRAMHVSFVANISRYIVSAPATTQVFDDTGALVTDQITSYDGNSPLVAPMVGDPTTTSTLESTSGRYLDTHRTFDSRGNLTSTTDPAGRLTSIAYDPRFNRFAVERCNPLWCTQIDWDEVLGQPLQERDANGQVTVHRYDPFGRHLRTTYPDGGCLQHEYLDFGNPAKFTQQRVRESYCLTKAADGLSQMVWVERYVDGLGRVWREERSGGYRRTRRFKEATGLAASEDSWRELTGMVVSRRFFYDPLWRPVSTLNPDGSSTSIAYGVGLVTTTDETGVSRVERRDGRDRVVSVTEHVPVNGVVSAAVTAYEYDSLDRVHSIIDSQGAVTSWSRNSLGWDEQVCDPDRGCRTRTFDDTGLLLTETDPAGQQTHYTYDTLGRRDTKELRDPAGQVTDTTTWAWDVDPTTSAPQGASVGLVTMTQRTSRYATSTEQRHYDVRGRPTLVRRCVSARCVEDRTTWDVAGRVAVIEYPDGSGIVSAASERVDHDYDLAGRLHQVGSYATAIGYMADDQLHTIVYGNATSETVGHDPRRAWVSGITVTGSSGAILDTAYTYDASGRLTGEDRVSPLPFQKRFGYDSVGRLATVTGAETDVFTYDSAGNIASRAASGAYTYGDRAHAHAVTDIAGQPYTYDPNGNLISDPNRQLEWDGDNQPVSITARAGRTTLAYDAEGQRTQQTTSAGVTSYFGRYAEIDPNGDVIRSYWAGNRLLARSAPLSDTRYYHHDRLGSTAAITDQHGQLIEAFAYDALGQRTSVYSGLADDHGFTGQRTDDETGLVYMNARYYDPEIGRFISADSVIPDATQPQSLNRYSYARNDPVNRVDPSGHADELAPAAAATSPPPPPVAAVAETANLPSTATNSSTLGATAVGWPYAGSPAQAYDYARGYIEALLSPLSQVGKGAKVNPGAQLCWLTCYALEVGGGVYFEPAGPDDFVLGEAHGFLSVGASFFGLTGEKDGLSITGFGLAANAGIDVQGFVTVGDDLSTNGGMGRLYGAALGPIGVEYSESLDGPQQTTYSLGTGKGVGGGVWTYTEYTWDWH